MQLNEERYIRHIILPQIGKTGQEKINQAKVLVVGAGGLGSPILFYLAAAGVGTIGIMDDDLISENNLQRQILYDSSTVGLPKVKVARHKLLALNPNCKVIDFCERLTGVNASAIIADYDVIADATDNLLSRYLIDDTCRAIGKPFVYGSICEFQGQVSVFHHQGGPGYRDLFPYPENIHSIQQSAGVIGALPGIIGSIQATEILKIILGSPDTLSGKLLLIDAWKNSFHILSF